MKRTVLAIGSALVMIAFSVTLGGAAWSATAAPVPAVHSSAPMATHSPCGCSTTTTTTTPPPTTTTTTAPPPTTTTTTTTTVPPTTTTTLPVPPPISGTGTQPPTPAVPTGPATTSVAAPLTQLPFTGRNIKPFLFAGVLLVGLGLALLAPSDYWRRGWRRLSALHPGSGRGLSGWMTRTSLALRRRGAPSVVGWSFLGL